MTDKPVLCPDCQAPLQVLLFMGVQPEAYVCVPCQRLYDFGTLKPGPVVLGLEEEPAP